MSDYSLLGSFSDGGASGLNAELITKLKDAETVTKVDPLTEEIENIPLETEKMDEIRTQIDSFIEMVDYFDIYSDENIFNQYVFDSSGASAVFDRDESSVLEDGLTSVHVDALAQKDIYQSDSVTNKTSTIGGTSEEDTITIGIESKPVYQSNAVYDNSSNALSNVSGSSFVGDFTINNGTTDFTITTDATTTWDDLKDQINNADSTLVAKFENNRLSITHSDGETELAFTSTSGDDIVSNLGLGESGKKFAAVKTERAYTGTNAVTTTDLVGEGSITLTTEGKSSITFDTNSTTTWDDLKDQIDDHPSYVATFDNDGKLKVVASDSSLAINISENLDVTVGFIGSSSSTSRTYEELADAINKDEDLEASMEKVGDDSYKLILKSAETGEDNLLTISTAGIIASDTTLKDLGTVANHVLTAQNLEATVDGINYNLSSNTIELDSGLDITAVKVDEGTDVTTLTVSKDTEAVTLAVEALITQYNSLYDMINEEIDDTDSPIEDKDMLSNILDTVKDMLFQSYGAGEPEYGSKTDSYGDIELSYSNVTNNTINLFSLGIELDQYGALSLDSETFEEIVSGDNENFDFDDLKNVFTGTYTNKGVGVQIQEYLKSLDSYQGALYDYDLDVIERQAELETKKEDEVDALDVKYDAMAAKFAAYAALITTMESSFSSLELMINESTSDS